jgi:light-regulated signal transduction histidine kinase (bacteriophytochrome)
MKSRQPGHPSTPFYGGSSLKNTGRDEWAAKLIFSDKERMPQNRKEEKLDSESIITNQEFLFQNEEREKRAAELLMAVENLKKAEEQVSILNKELESFAFSVSHDLRAPLRAVQGFAKILKTNYTTLPHTETNRLIDNILNNAEKMGLLINELLSFSRLSQKELQKVELPMEDMVKNICADLQLQFSKVVFNITPLPPAVGDKITIRQVWLNLVGNAIKYSRLKARSVVEIGSTVTNNETVYYVKDNGAGFDMQYSNKLFCVFQRLHSDEEFEGLGMGLAMAHRIVTKHSGRMWAEAKLNEGAVFYFTLESGNKKTEVTINSAT